MSKYREHYADLYWDLHLGIPAGEIPADTRKIGDLFVYALAAIDKATTEHYYESYMEVRRLRGPLKEWIAEGVRRVDQGDVERPEPTFMSYWLKNSKDAPAGLKASDVVFECFHNFRNLPMFCGFEFHSEITFRKLGKWLLQIRDSRQCPGQVMATNEPGCNEQQQQDADRTLDIRQQLIVKQREIQL